MARQLEDSTLDENVDPDDPSLVRVPQDEPPSNKKSRAIGGRDGKAERYVVKAVANWSRSTQTVSVSAATGVSVNTWPTWPEQSGGEWACGIYVLAVENLCPTRCVVHGAALVASSITGRLKRGVLPSVDVGRVFHNGNGRRMQRTTASPALLAGLRQAVSVSLGQATGAVGVMWQEVGSSRAPDNATLWRPKPTPVTPTWATPSQSSNRFPSDVLALLWLFRRKWFSIQMKK